MTRPDGSFETFKYDDAGNKIEHVDVRGVKTTFVYDAANRLIEKHVNAP